MKLILLVSALLFNLNAFCAINLNIEIEESLGVNSTIIEEQLQTEIGKKITIKDTNLNREIEILMSKNFPKAFKDQVSEDSLMFTTKIFKRVNNKRKLINSSQIMAKKGKKATYQNGSSINNKNVEEFKISLLAE